MNRRKHGVWFGAFGLAGIILSHTITGYVTVVFYLIVFHCISSASIKEKFHVSFIIYHLSLLLVGLGLSAFWLPAITEMGYTNVAGQIGVPQIFAIILFASDNFGIHCGDTVDRPRVPRWYVL